MASRSTDDSRLRAAIRLVLQRYVRQVKASPWLAALSLLLPGIGNIFVFYVPPLAIASVLTTVFDLSSASISGPGMSRAKPSALRGLFFRSVAR